MAIGIGLLSRRLTQSESQHLFRANKRNNTKSLSSDQSSEDSSGNYRYPGEGKATFPWLTQNLGPTGNFNLLLKLCPKRTLVRLNPLLKPSRGTQAKFLWTRCLRRCACRPSVAKLSQAHIGLHVQGVPPWHLRDRQQSLLRGCALRAPYKRRPPTQEV